MAEDLFNYPAAPPQQNSSTSPRPKTSREASRKRRRRKHHQSQDAPIENENQQTQEEEEQQQQERPQLPTLNKDKNSRSSREISQSNFNSKSDVSGTNVSSSTKKNSNTAEVDNNQFEEEEIDEVLYWTEESIKNPSILTKCNPDLLPSVIVCLKDTRDQCLVNGDTDDSCLADVALTEARKVHKKNLVHIATKSMREDLEARLQEAEEALRDLEETCEYQEDRMNKEMARETSVLMDKHKNELERLIATWTSEPPPPSPGEPEIEPGKTYSTTSRPTTSRKNFRTTNDREGKNIEDTGDQVNTENQDDDQFYDDDGQYNEDTVKKFRQYNKFSPQLRYLQDQADRLLKAKRYQEFKMVEKKAKELEMIEIQNNHFRMEKDYNAALEALQVKQTAELMKQEKAQEDRRRAYLHAKNFDMTVAKRRIEKLQRELEECDDPDKIWALHHRHDFAMPSPVNQSPSQTQTQGGVYSSRGVFETSASSTTGKASPFQEKFNKLNLPPLKSGRSSRRLIKNTERSFKFNNGYVFT